MILKGCSIELKFCDGRVTEWRVGLSSSDLELRRAGSFDREVGDIWCEKVLE